MKLRPISFLLALCLVLTASLACARKADHCWVCEREIHPQVRATLTLGDGKKVSACCPRCALHYMEEPGRAVREIRVTDYASGQGLALERALLVEGSDEAPCMQHPPVADETRSPMHVCYDRCMPSLIAFRDAGAARAFMDDHGGMLRSPGAPPAAAGEPAAAPEASPATR
jgi:hypothetical protein